MYVLAKRLDGGVGGGSARTSTVTHFNEISTVNRKIAPPHPEFITKKDR